MNNYILVSRTYCEWDEESAEDGEFSDHGFIDKREPLSFRELVDLMERHPQSSQWPNDGNIHVWYSTYEEQNYRTGVYRSESIHYHQDNTSNAEKYWKWAAKIAGHLIKK
jgi:hypothetical protein